MRSSRKLLYVIALTASLLVVFAAAGLPSASADACTIHVTVVGGNTYTFYVNVPPGTPIVAFDSGERSALKPGETIFTIARVEADGKLVSQRVQVSKDGVKPAH